MKRSCKQSSSTPGKPTRKSQRADAFSLQQIQEGNVDLFHPEIKKKKKNKLKISESNDKYTASSRTFSLDHARKVTVKLCKSQKCDSRPHRSLNLSRAAELRRKRPLDRSQSKYIYKKASMSRRDGTKY